MHDDLTARSDDAALRDEKAMLVSEISAIQEQLANRNRRNQDTGLRLNSVEWNQWRHRALIAKRLKEERLRAVKHRIHELQQAKDTAERPPKAPLQSSGDWKQVLMRALDESQRDRDRLREAMQIAVNYLKAVKADTAAAQARDLLIDSLRLNSDLRG